MLFSGAQTIGVAEASKIAERLSAVMNQRGCTQRELAHKSGVSLSNVSRLVKGESRIRKGTIVRVAEALQVPATYLFHGGELPLVTTNTREPMSIMVAEGMGGGYGNAQPTPEGVTMAQAMEIIAKQMNVPIDKVRQLVLTGLVQSEAEPKKKG